jgi:hypothetical protein
MYFPNANETIYCDESSTECRYMGFGGLWIPDICEEALRDAIRAERVAAGFRQRSEFKWQKITGKKIYPGYREIVSAFFATPECRFNAIVVDHQNPGRNRGQDDELDFYVTAHWLIRRRIQRECEYDLVLDHRTNRREDRLPVLLDVLNNSARRDHGHRRDVVRSVRAVDSKRDDLLQLADVLLGAVCYCFNDRHLEPDRSPAKAEMAEFIAREAGFRTGIIGTTPRSATKFNVWRFRS